MLKTYYMELIEQHLGTKRDGGGWQRDGGAAADGDGHAADDERHGAIAQVEQLTGAGVVGAEG